MLPYFHFLLVVLCIPLFIYLFVRLFNHPFISSLMYSPSHSLTYAVYISTFAFSRIVCFQLFLSPLTHQFICGEACVYEFVCARTPTLRICQRKLESWGIWVMERCGEAREGSGFFLAKQIEWGSICALQQYQYRSRSVYLTGFAQDSESSKEERSNRKTDNIHD